PRRPRRLVLPAVCRHAHEKSLAEAPRAGGPPPRAQADRPPGHRLALQPVADAERERRRPDADALEAASTADRAGRGWADRPPPEEGADAAGSGGPRQRRPGGLCRYPRGDARGLGPAGRPAPALAVVLASLGHAAKPGDRVDAGRHRLPPRGDVDGAGLRA